MKKMLRVKTYCLLIILTICLISCKEKHLHTHSSSYINDVPDTSKGFNHLQYLKLKKIEEGLNMNKLDQEVDSLELRLWAKHSLSSGGRVYVIKKINKQWTCLLYKYIISRKDWYVGTEFQSYYLNFKVDSFQVKILNPKSGWNKFFNEIEKENIYELPDQEKIKNFKNSVNDGLDFYVEFANNVRRGYYYYNCPDCYENKYIECKHMSNILDVFYIEFGLQIGYNGNKCFEKGVSNKLIKE